MRTNGAFNRPRTADRLRNWWYGTTPAQRVNKLLYLLAGLSLVAFVNAANRDVDRPGTGLTATGGRATVPAFVPTTSLHAAALPGGATPVPPDTASTTSTSTSTSVPGTTTVSRLATTTTRRPSQPAQQSTPTPTGDPGVIFSDPPAATASPDTPATPDTTAPPATSATTTPAPTTTGAPTPTTATPTTAAPVPPTTATTAPSLLQWLFGG